MERSINALEVVFYEQYDIVNHRRSLLISHHLRPPRQKDEDVRRMSVDCPVGLEHGDGSAKRGRTCSKVG